MFGVGAFTVSTAGSYTAISAALTQASTTGGGTGATFNSASYGGLTFTISNAGSYTTNASSFSQASTTGSGAGITFNTAAYGVKTVTVGSPVGAYTALPSNPVAQGASSGSGVGATFNVLWGLLAGTVVDGGTGYDTESTLVITGGGSTGGGAGVIVLDAISGYLSLVNAPSVGDIIDFGGVSFAVSSYVGAS